ncbi:MAG: bifunctional phosphopantothenoylcysteine decarboxylase/phosphopantothenate synthase, partial [Caulobacteraceae bacterium]
LSRKGCDWIVANDVGAEGILGGDENEVLLVYPPGTDRWARMSKAEVARRLAARIAEDLA